MKEIKKGRWTAEIYLLFAEGRTDIFPAGDLAVQIEIGRILGITEGNSKWILFSTKKELQQKWRGAR